MRPSVLGFPGNMESIPCPRLYLVWVGNCLKISLGSGRGSPQSTTSVSTLEQPESEYLVEDQSITMAEITKVVKNFLVVGRQA